MNTSVSGNRGRSSGPRWPELPRVPKSLLVERDAQQWDEQMQTMWQELRGQLDRISTEGRDISIVNGGAVRILNFNGGDGGGTNAGSRGGTRGSSGGITRRTPLDFPSGQEQFVSKEGGTFLVRLDGTRVFYQDDPPSEGREGDLWFETDNKFKPYIFHDGKWEDIFANVPGLSPLIGGGFDPRALLAQANAQAEALLAERTDRDAAIVSLQQTLQTVDTALARQFQVLNATVRDPNTGLVKAHARITSEQKVRATADEAFAEDIETLDARVGDAEGAIVTERSVRAAADGSVIARVAEAITASGGGATQTSGVLIIGATYKITANSGGADFTGVGAANNLVNTTFTATATTPTWGTGSLKETRLASVETWGAARITKEGNLAAEYVLDVSTVGASGFKKTTGFRLTTEGGGVTGDSEFVLQAEKFSFVTSGSTQQTSGALDYTAGPPARGGTYVISQAGGNFTNVGAPNNNVNTRFVATGTTPASWGTGGVIKLTVPFKISGDTAYIDKAVITEVTAGAIEAGTINVALNLTAATLNSPLITGGIIRLIADSTICGRVANDGILRMNGGGSNGQAYGGQIDVLGNDYTTIGGFQGSVLLTPGNHTNGTVRLRDRTGADRIVVNADGTVTLSQLNGFTVGGISIGAAPGFVTVPNQLWVYGATNPRTGDAPLRSDGGAWIQKDLDVRQGIFAVGNITGDQLISAAGRLKLNAGGRHELSSVAGRSVSIAPQGTEAWIFSTDTHLKTLGGGIRKVSSDGWTVPLFDGDNDISFQWDGVNFKVKVDSTVMTIL